MLPSNQLPGPPNQPTTPFINQQRLSDKKCNVVFYDIAECPPNTSKPARSQSDHKNILSAVPNIESSAIKDLHRLAREIQTKSAMPKTSAYVNARIEHSNI